MTTDEQHEANLRSPNVGVRWQAEMEEHLAVVRERLRVIARLSVSGSEVVQVHAAVAQAAATAALALAIANTGNDLEVALSRVAEQVELVEKRS